MTSDNAPMPPGDAPAADSRSGAPLAVLAVLALLVLILGFAGAAMFQRGFVRRAVARARADMRALAVGLETYSIDNMTYPAMTMQRDLAPDAARYPAGMPMARTFRIPAGAPLSTLTTPVAYLLEYPEDPFTGQHRLGYRYYNARGGWIVASYGPDRDLLEGGQLGWHEGDEALPVDPRVSAPGMIQPFWDDPQAVADPEAVMPDATVERVYRYEVTQPAPELLAGVGVRGAYTYDPTNGVISAGDVWRVK